MTNKGSNSYLESSTNSEVEGDSMEVEANLGDLSQLYFVLDNMKYHVEQPINPKSNNFVTNYFSNLGDKMLRQMVSD